MSHNKKIELYVEGMTCQSCEFVIESRLNGVPGIQKAHVRFHGQRATVNCDDTVTLHQMNEALAQDGYKLSTTQHHSSKNSTRDYVEIAGVALVFLGLYLVFKDSSLFSTQLAVTQNMSLGLIFMVGLVAASSSCIAVTGGVLLAVSAKFNEAYRPQTRFQKFLPHLLFNLGRIVSYTILGGLIGLLGSALTLSPFTTGVLTLIAAIFMILMGFRMLKIFPWLTRLSIPMPRFLSEGVLKLEGKKGKWVSFAAGAMTFFLPCGFTQAFQLYAISTGSFAQGALTLGIFSLGTLPALLSLSVISSFARGSFARLFFKVSGVLVLFFGFFNIGNGLTLTGVNLYTPLVSSGLTYPLPTVAPQEAEMQSGVQIVKMIVDGRGYTPNKFIIKKGVPVRWEIDGRNAYGCQSFIVMPKLKIQKFVENGANLVAFVPEETGTLPFSCSMGMYRGVFEVTE